MRIIIDDYQSFHSHCRPESNSDTTPDPALVAQLDRATKLVELAKDACTKLA
jgi:hypothetical protein